MYIMRENVFRPYIASAAAVFGSDLSAAVRAAAAAGCEYYYDPGVKTNGGETVVIGYSRTANESEAVTRIIAAENAPDNAGYESAGEIKTEKQSFSLYVTRNGGAGNPVLGFTGPTVPVRASDVMNKWAEKTFVRFNSSAYSINLIKNDELYIKFQKDESPLTNVAVTFAAPDGATFSPFAYICKAAGLPGYSPAQTDTQTKDTEDGFDPEGYLTDTAEKIADDKAPDYITASVFGGGTVYGVIIAAAAALGAACGVILFAVKNKKRKAEEQNDEN